MDYHNYFMLILGYRNEANEKPLILVRQNSIMATIKTEMVTLRKRLSETEKKVSELKAMVKSSPISVVNDTIEFNEKDLTPGRYYELQYHKASYLPERNNGTLNIYQVVA